MSGVPATPRKRGRPRKRKLSGISLPEVPQNSIKNSKADSVIIESTQSDRNFPSTSGEVLTVKTNSEERFFEGITSSDLELFRSAQLRHRQASSSRGDDNATSSPPGTKKPPMVIIGENSVQALYVSQYSCHFEDYETLFICEHCMMYWISAEIFSHHKRKCSAWHPPGSEVYRKEGISMFEVDAAEAKTYCVNVCLLSKLFLQDKVLCFEVEPFYFYVLVEHSSVGCHFVGYFSKPKEEGELNLSCKEGTWGTPDRPLSSFGQKAYESYWKSVLLEYFYARKGFLTSVTVQDIRSETGIKTEDILETLIKLEFLHRDDLQLPVGGPEIQEKHSNAPVIKCSRRKRTRNVGTRRKHAPNVKDSPTAKVLSEKPTFDKDSPQKSSFVKDSPQKSAKMFKDSPQKSPKIFKDSPQTSAKMFKDSPQKSAKLFEDSPQASAKMFKDSPQTSAKMFKDSSQKSAKMLEDSPQRSAKMFKDSPQKSAKIFKDSPKNDEVIVKHSPMKGRQTLFCSRIPIQIAAQDPDHPLYLEINWKLIEESHVRIQLKSLRFVDKEALQLSMGVNLHRKYAKIFETSEDVEKEELKKFLELDPFEECASPDPFPESSIPTIAPSQLKDSSSENLTEERAPSEFMHSSSKTSLHELTPETLLDRETFEYTNSPAKPAQPDEVQVFYEVEFIKTSMQTSKSEDVVQVGSKIIEDDYFDLDLESSVVVDTNKLTKSEVSGEDSIMLLEFSEEKQSSSSLTQNSSKMKPMPISLVINENPYETHIFTSTRDTMQHSQSSLEKPRSSSLTQKSQSEPITESLVIPKNSGEICSDASIQNSNLGDAKWNTCRSLVLYNPNFLRRHFWAPLG
ncbi:unnamed protein product [Allacma fusca]|uniref:MYST-type HAT domain-containing protein n=1 Tax=Allacma fusca TaxID=39272 RepID=A0A8J2P3I3_9HEXA|nr:unnamed protein product [Allacma fusca]